MFYIRHKRFLPIIFTSLHSQGWQNHFSVAKQNPRPVCLIKAFCSSKPLDAIHFTSTHCDIQRQTNKTFAILSMPAFWEQSFMPCDGGPLVWSDGILRASRLLLISRFTSRNLAIFHHFLRFRINRHRLSGKIIISSILRSHRLKFLYWLNT